MPSDDAVAEARCEAFDLSLDAPVMSAVEPFGTWQYAQSVCLPAGARVGSNIVGCTSRT